MANFPIITSEQMAEVDRLAVKHGLKIMQMMEHAALNIARFAQLHSPRHILILAGKGHNGGDGIAAARHFHNWGIGCEIILAEPVNSLKETSRHHYDLVQKMGVHISTWRSSPALPETDLIIDALLGYSINGDPRRAYAEMIHAANASSTTLLAIDLPSGLDGSTGQPNTPTIKAIQTLTLDLPKVGLMQEAAKPYVGEIYVANLGIPTFIHKKAGIDMVSDPFKTNSIQLFLQ